VKTSEIVRLWPRGENKVKRKPFFYAPEKLGAWNEQDKNQKPVTCVDAQRC